MKKTHYLKWLCLVVCTVFAMEAQAQITTPYEIDWETGVTKDDGGSAIPRRYRDSEGIGRMMKNDQGSSSVGDADACGGKALSMGSGTFTFQTYLDNVVSFVIVGQGSGSNRTLNEIAISTTTSGALIYTATADYTADPTNAFASSSTCGRMEITPTTPLAAGTYVRVTFSGNVNISKVILNVAPTAPVITLESGEQNAVGDKAEMEKIAIDNVVYSYINAEDTDIVIEWVESDYTTPAEKPAGIDFATDNTAKTITLSGTPDEGSVGTYYYKITAEVTGVGSDFKEGSIQINTYVAPDPEIALTSGAETFTAKAGDPITPIVYTFKHIGAEPTLIVNGIACASFPCDLGNGLTAEYTATSVSGGTLTISGTPEVKADPADYIDYKFDFAVSAPATSDYTGTITEVNASGIITISNPNPPKKPIRQCH